MEIKIKSEPIYTITLSLIELNALEKFIGNTSTNDRMNNYRLTQEEDDIIENIYDVINETLEEE